MIKEALEFIRGTAAIDFITELVPRKVFVRDGERYEYHSTVDEFSGNGHCFSTLDGLVEYLKSFRKIDAPGYPLPGDQTITVRVTDPKSVVAYAPITENRTRPELAMAAPVLPTPKFGQFIDLEEFVIWLQTSFFETAEREMLRSVVSKISAETSVSLADDGITQSVQVKNGVHLSAKASLPAIIRLLPIRTFHEEGLDRCDSPFLLRVKKVGDDEIRLCLFEADGCAWQVQQTQFIRRYLIQAFAPEDNVLVLA
jgi:hypothetical protein